MTEIISIRRTRPTPEQASEIVSLLLTLFSNDSLRLAFFPKDKDSEADERAYREGNILRAADDPNKPWILAFLETTLLDGTTHQKIIGYSQFELPDSSRIVKTEEEKKAEKERHLSYRPDSMDKLAHDKISGEVMSLFGKLSGGDAQRYWFLWMLGVDPAHRRKGLATKLVNWGVERAAKEGKGVILLAAPSANPFYDAMGFIQEGEVVILGETYFGRKLEPPTAAPMDS